MPHDEQWDAGQYRTGEMRGGAQMGGYHQPRGLQSQEDMITQANAAWDKFFYMCRLPLELGE